MSVPDPIPTPLLPAGVEFYLLTGFAETWEVYFALRRKEGWRETRNSGACWKTLVHGGGQVIVHPPKSGDWSQREPGILVAAGVLFELVRLVAR